MKKPVDLLALAIVLVASVTLLSTVSALPVHTTWDSPLMLSKLELALEKERLLLRKDISITLSGSPVAAGFSRPGCQGTLLLAPMPNTAQGWGHMAPLLDLEAFEVSYHYRGTFHDSPPLMDRILDSAKALFKTQPQRQSQAIHAVAEIGHCGLAETAHAVLSEI